MNKKLKNALKASFEAPPPADKERFLKALRFPRISRHQFFLSQFRFIRKRVWALSVMIVLIGWALAVLPPAHNNWTADADKIWSVSAVLPFLAMFTASELYRSSFYRMAELETVCRFSLPQIIMARITILGGGNFVILALLLIFMSRASAYSMLQVIAYLMVPYLVTCGVCLCILNRVRGRESVYGCAAAACLVCVTNITFGNTIEFLYTNVCLNYWILLFVFSGVLIVIQVRKLLKQTEDKTWNLLLNE